MNIDFKISGKNIHHLLILSATFFTIGVNITSNGLRLLSAPLLNRSIITPDKKVQLLFYGN
ncbi:MAG: hypothetical protein QXQ66_01055 [Candidatus Hadarchaeum sp.]|uniref:hypothetical protein n=1 Tax=Candidatus Hadarchaeum sp. TaxID=2883567 RepID=UPI00316F5790